MQFQVPQFINIEDKIIGPLTLKQFLYILFTAIILFILFKLLNFIIFIILAIPVLALAYSLAFIQVNRQPFINVIKNFFGFLRKPDFYIWKKPSPKSPIEEKKIPKIIKKIPAKKNIKRPGKQHIQDIGWRINIEK